MAELLLKDPKDYILLEYELRRNRRPSYSMRAFARDLEFSPSSLNDFLKERVGMSEKRVHQLATKLNWSVDRRQHFFDLIQTHFEKDKSVRQTASMRVKLRLKDKATYFDEDRFKVVSNWYHLVVCEMCHVVDQISPTLISAQIDISVAEAKKALADLSSLGIIQMTERGYKPTSDSFQYGDSTPSEAIQNFHYQVLQQAQKAVLTKGFHQQECHSLVFTMRAEDRDKMNQEIRKSLYAIVNKYAISDTNNSVQIVALQSFEVAHLEQK